MPHLIDGNNLLFALADVGIDVGRAGLCELLAGTLGGERVCVVFDGAPPPGGMARQITATGLEVRYSIGRTADEIIVARITADTAPRRLTVVSSDREIRRAAERRRCLVETSQEFARRLKRLAEPRQRPAAPEPPEKRRGLTAEQTEHWMREFGLDK